MGEEMGEIARDLEQVAIFAEDREGARGRHGGVDDAQAFARTPSTVAAVIIARRPARRRRIGRPRVYVGAAALGPQGISISALFQAFLLRLEHNHRHQCSLVI